MTKPSNPIFSVVIPIHNKLPHLERSINSVLNQTYQDFEVLIIDDHSPEPLNLYTDKRIKVYRNDVNKGPGLSRDVGLDKANGEYIAFLDSDDYWHKDFLRNTIQAFSDNKDIAMVCGQVVEVNEKGHVFKRRRNNTFELTTILPYILQKGRPWCTSACLWNASIAKNSGMWINSRNWEDYVFDVSIAFKNNNVKTLHETLVYYDASGDDKLSYINIKQTLPEKYKSLRAIISKVVQLNDNELKDICLLNIKHICFGLTAQSTDISSKDITKKYLKLAVSNKMINRFEYLLLLSLSQKFIGRYLRHKKASINRFREYKTLLNQST